MIQRIQTVYLAVASVITMIVLLVEPKFAFTEVGDVADLILTPVNIIQKSNGAENIIQSSFAIAGILSFGLFLSVFAITRYKDRKLQIKLAQGAILTQLVAGVAVFYYADQMVKSAENMTVSYSPILSFLLVNIVLYALAVRGIKKDDELVRSADRLR